jgi:hypothetical protein
MAVSDTSLTCPKFPLRPYSKALTEANRQHTCFGRTLLSPFGVFKGSAKNRGGRDQPPLALPHPTLGSGTRERAANRSAHRILPVTCMTTNSVIMAIIVIASPVNPFQKNAYENNTR